MDPLLTPLSIIGASLLIYFGHIKQVKKALVAGIAATLLIIASFVYIQTTSTAPFLLTAMYLPFLVEAIGLQFLLRYKAKQTTSAKSDTPKPASTPASRTAAAKDIRSLGLKIMGWSLIPIALAVMFGLLPTSANEVVNFFIAATLATVTLPVFLFGLVIYIIGLSAKLLNKRKS